MRLTKHSTVALLVFFVLLASASLPLARAGPPRPEPLSKLKATENTEGKPFSELSAPSVASVVQADAENVELVAQIGGITYAVAVQGGYAYLGVGPRLVVLDILNPANPTRVGQTELLSGVVEDVFLSGPYAYVAAEPRFRTLQTEIQR